MDQNRTTRSIPCDDACDRARQMLVIGSPAGITFVAPPGGSGRVHPRHYDALQRAIRDALDISVRLMAKQDAQP